MRLIHTLWRKFVHFVRRVIHELKDPVNITIYLAVVTIFFSPCIIGYTLTLVTHRPRGAIIATAYWLFWAGPFTPAMPIQFAITFALSKPVHTLIRRHQRKHGAKWL